MPFNLLKVYNQLLEIDHLDESQRMISLRGIFNRDIAENSSFLFQSKRINPTPGIIDPLEILFKHLTTVVIDKSTRRREFEPDRSKRIHWVKYHIDEMKITQMKIFSVQDQEGIRTYIYDEMERYVIILEPYRNRTEYYLLTAYFVDGRNVSKMENKYKRRLPELY